MTAATDYRKIIHIDMDAFFAAVEQMDHPELRGRPVAVGHADGRGVVATASYEARAYGVHSAMPSRKARQLCPELVFVEGRMSRYKAVSRSIRDIFHRYTDLVEPISIDEAFLDVTNNRMGIAMGVDVARAIKQDIREEIGLVASAGVSYNKFLAKIASDWRKPDGLCTIHPDRAIEFIDQLKVEHIWGVGPRTAQRMHEMGISMARELRELTLPEMIRRFGKVGYDYYRFVRGEDDRPVSPVHERKSVGCEHTFDTDVCDARTLDMLMQETADDLVGRMERAEFSGRTLTLKVRFWDFRTVSRSISRGCDWYGLGEIIGAARELLESIEIPEKGVRLMGLSVSNRVEENPLQAELF